MVQTVPDILARIVEHKKTELHQRSVSVEVLREAAELAVVGRRNFAANLRARKPAVIAEIKKASPSKGVFREDFRPAEIAVEYESGGAAALSVLTDQQFFQGKLEDLRAARGAVGIPVLRKDFTIDEYHVVEAAANGADAILLIAAILSEAELRRFRELAASFRMDAIVEVHHESELDRAVGSGAEIIGVNNRDLHTFRVSLQTSLELAKRIPPDVLKISESGIESREHIEMLSDAGYTAFLIGEHLMKSGNEREALRKLTHAG